MSKETYIGDGLYASFDGYQYKLRAPRPFGDHEVFLDIRTMESFLRFVGDHLGGPLIAEEARHVAARAKLEERKG
jgi:hypothetical protein